jgi:NADH:ubiquinone oxidoreductase subunit 4 (subunit M)
MLGAQLLPLLVAVPLLGAALGAMLPERISRMLMLILPALTTAGGAALLVTHRETPVLAHHVGGWVPGIAIPFVSDMFSAVMITVTGIATLACVTFALQSGEAKLRFFPALVLMLSAGVNGALLTGDLFNLFVFIEVMLLPSYALIAMTGTWRRLGIGRLFVQSVGQHDYSMTQALVMLVVAIFVFLLPPTMGELTSRLRGRKTDDPDALMERATTASWELGRVRDFDYVVFNETDKVEETLRVIDAIIVAEGCRIHQPEAE